MKHIPIFILSAGSIMGCMHRTGSNSLVNAVDSQKDDVQVLSADVSNGRELNSSTFDLKKCSLIGTAEDTAFNRYDCSPHLAEIENMPAMQDVVIWAEKRNDQIATGYLCHALKVRTVTLKAAFDSPSFQGIGFWTRHTGARLIPKSQLVEAGRSRLKDGREVIIHTFVGIASCWQGSMTSSTYAVYDFKAYASFQENGVTFNNWEAADNRSVSGRNPKWDRSSELLK